MPVTARTCSGSTLASNSGPIHRAMSGDANVIRQTVMPNTSVKRDARAVDHHGAQPVDGAGLVAGVETNDDWKHQPVELIADLTLKVGEPERDREHGNRRRADRCPDDHVVEVEADLDGNVDHEHVHAERRHLPDQ